MRIDKVILKNIGPHKQLTADLGAGLVGIVGANGSGKSTLVNAIYAALTGDFSRLGDTKADAIHNDAEGPSYIEVHGSHHNQKFFVHRGLKPNKTRIEFDGNDAVTSTRAANDELLNRLNVPKLVVDNYVFVDQWRMFGFLDQRESERARVLQYLCRTEKAEKIYKACNAFVAKHSTSHVIDNSVELTQTLDQYREQLVSVAAEGKEAAKKVLSAERRKEMQTAIDNYKSLAETEKDFAQVRKKAESAAVDLQQAEEVMASTADELKQLSVKEEDLRSKCENAKTFLSRLKLRDAAFQDLEDAQAAMEEEASRLDAVRADLAALEEPLSKLPVTYNLEEATDELAVKREELASKKRTLEAIQSDSSAAVCSRCMQPLDRKIAATWAEDLENLQVRIAALHLTATFLAREAALKQALDNGQAALTAASKRVEACKSATERKELHVPANVTADACRKLISKYDEVAAALRQAEKRHTQARVAAEGCKSTLQHVKSREEELSAKVAKLRKALAVAEPLAVLREALEVSKAAEIARDSAANTYKRLKDSLKYTEDALASLKDKIRKHKKQQSKLQIVERVASAFHWQQLPKAVSSANLKKLVDDINETLSLFKDPFTVEANEDLAFNVFFPGKPAVRATQLSGGQKVVLATAFRTALDRMLGTDVGMLFLDEPTAGLDSDNVAYFHEALQLLSSRLEGRRQVVVITHLHEFCDRFDSLIEIG